MKTTRVEQKTEKLKLTEPAAALWKLIRNRLTELRQSEEGTERRVWMMTGGTVLAARWNHRRSSDIDLVTTATWQLQDLGASGSSAFTRAMTALGGKLKAFNDATIEMTFPERQQLHIFRSRPEPAVGQQPAMIDGELFTAASTTQILAGKLLHRALYAPARDLYDVIIAGERDPARLHQAVNMLSPEMQNNITMMWHVRREKIESDARATLKAVSDTTVLAIQPAVLVARAIDTIEAARYEKIRAVPARTEEPASIVGTTGDGKAAPIAVPHSAVEEVLEASGMNHCLAARLMDRERFVASLHTEREFPTRVRNTESLPARPAPPRRGPAEDSKRRTPPR